jgi:transcriptional regulator with XRE-family HTH domain
MRKITNAMRDAVLAELEKQGLSKRQLALKLDVTPQYIGQVLSGQRALVSDSWEDILEVLGLEVEVKPGARATAQEPPQ